MEKIVRCEDGSRAKIKSSGEYRELLQLEVTYCEKGKRKFKETCDTNCYKYRSADTGEREKLRREAAISFVGITAIRTFIDEYNESKKIGKDSFEF